MHDNTKRMPETPGVYADRAANLCPRCRRYMRYTRVNILGRPSNGTMWRCDCGYYTIVPDHEPRNTRIIQN